MCEYILCPKSSRIQIAHVIITSKLRSVLCHIAMQGMGLLPNCKQTYRRCFNNI